MAYAPKLLQDEDQQNQGVTTGSQSLSGSGGTGSGGSVVSAPSTPQNVGGNQFPDISRYLSQNKDAGNRLASKVGGNVLQAGNEARGLAAEGQNKLNTAQSTFNQNLTQNKVAPVNQTVLDKAKSDPTSFFQKAPANSLQNVIPYATKSYVTPTKQTIQAPVQSTATPTGPLAVSDQGGLDQFTAMRDAAYKGPTELGYTGDYGALDEAISKAGNLSQKATTDTGRLDLLRNLYGGGVTSPGVANLDNFLLRGSGAQNLLSNVAKQNAGIDSLGTNLRSSESAATADALAKANAETTAAQNVRNQVQDAFTGTDGAYTNFDKDYDARLAQAQTDAAKVRDQYFGSTNNVDQQIPEIEAIRNQLSNITNVANPADYEKLQAINQLLGTNLGL